MSDFGNYLRKTRVNFYLSADARRMLHELSLRRGVSHTAIIELAVRDMYDALMLGKPPEVERVKRFRKSGDSLERED